MRFFVDIPSKLKNILNKITNVHESYFNKWVVIILMYLESLCVYLKTWDNRSVSSFYSRPFYLFLTLLIWIFAFVYARRKFFSFYLF